MAPEIGRFWFRVGLFLAVVAALLLPFQPRDSAEFVITAITLGMGLLLLLLVVIIVKLSH